MKIFRILLISLMVLGISSAAWALDARASLNKNDAGISQAQQPQTRAVLLSENFDATTFPPTGWTNRNVDGGGSQWARSTTYPYGGSVASAYHTWGSGMQNGWLITPRIAIPTGVNATLTFKTVTLYPGDYYSHTVMIIASDANTPPAVTDPGWTQIWEEPNPLQSWADGIAPIPSSYVGQNIYLAFVYQGDFADGWIIDNVALDAVSDVEHDLTISVDPIDGGTTIPPVGVNAIPEDTVVNLIATPGFGYTWDQWTGDVDNTATHRTTLTMDQDYTIQAKFTPYGLDNLFVQDVLGGNAVNATKDTNEGLDYERAEYFVGPIDTIDKLVFHALPMTHDGAGWVEWTPRDQEYFTVRFYDAGPTEEPDWNNPVYSETLQAKMFSVGPVWSYTGFKIELELANSVALSSGWASVQCDVDAGSNGWFLLLSSEDGTGDGVHYFRNGATAAINEHDICLEIWGTELAAAPTAPVLLSPVAQANLPKSGFNFRWQMGSGGGTPDSYALFLYEDDMDYPDNPAYMWEEITGNQFNPVNDLDNPMAYEYSERWYWAVAAYGGGQEVVSNLSFFEIMADPTIRSFPWEDGFVSYDDFALNFLPWTQYDGDGSNTYTIQNLTFPNQGYTGSYIIYNSSQTTPPLTSAPAHGGDKFAACFAAVNGPNDDWLISPPIEAVADLSLSFWAQAYTTSYPEAFRVLVSTTDTNPTSFTEISDGDIVPGDDWAQYNFPLDYPGQTIYFAVQCVSDDAFFLMLDDFRLEVLTFDELPPTITHLPLINTPITDAPYPVVALIKDDTLWNNPIDYANLYYSIDEGDNYYGPIAMTAMGDDIYVAEIPAQELETNVWYYIEAADTEGNIATDDNEDYDFWVENPAWLMYFHDATNALGLAAADFGVATVFENPFFGSDDPLWLLSVGGAFTEENVTATLMVYELDEVEEMWNGVIGGEVTFPTADQILLVDLED
ncbi:MAG: hypothetical protein GX294_04600, partial [Candidatus Cloacimonetes bacterium]|nr:hypothetical protein [Candidatus Cloacimonadota bacterium]